MKINELLQILLTWDYDIESHGEYEHHIYYNDELLGRVWEGSNQSFQIINGEYEETGRGYNTLLEYLFLLSLNNF